jgi:hypothetical protein
MDTSQTQSGKSFWSRPEGAYGKGIVAVVGAVGLVGLYKVLPFLITLAQNTIYLGALIGVLALMWWLVTSERVRTLLFYGFQIMSRSIASLFINIDPISILKAFAAEMREKGQEVDASIDRMNGVKRALDGEINRSSKEMQQALRLADVAKDEDALNVQAERAGRRNANLQKYQEMQNVVMEILTQLTRVKKRVDYHIANSEDEMNELIRQNQIAKTVAQATAASRSALGYSDKLEIRNMAADSIREKYSNAIGELDGLIQSGKNLDSEIDLSTLAFRADGQAKLVELHKKLNQAEGVPQSSIVGLPASNVLGALGSGAVAPVQVPVGNKWAERLNHHE